MSAVIVAKILGVAGKSVYVQYPFCRQTHNHPRAHLGSGETLAPCHRPYGDMRTYAIPASPRKST
jgi:hypothetical protein